ncbi:MAG: formylglycine-generating enzyme family protein [Fibrobacter sp.]|nr:formylglycine-generating enzyme family protein [Fibrobacter sp.]
MNRIVFILILSLSFSFGNMFCVFDANGNCVSVLTNIREIQNVSRDGGYKKYYVAGKEGRSSEIKSSYKTVMPTKVKDRKKWYEVDWNQGVKLCPEKGDEVDKGIWIVNGSAHVDSLNCVLVDGSPYTRSILVLYVKNENDLTNADSSWLLINQTIINLSGKTFTIYKGLGSLNDKEVRDTSYTVQMKYDLIVDKTELRVRDALWLREDETVNKKESVLLFNLDYYPSPDSMDVLDYPSRYYEYYLNFRSKKDGLESTWTCVTPPKSLKQCFYNESANGYRLPYYDEWYVLQNAGQSKVFSWGNEFVEDSLKRYANIHCANNKLGVYPVKRYASNQYGLFDTYGNAEEKYYEKYDGNFSAVVPCSMASDWNPGKACREMARYKCLGRNAIASDGVYRMPGFQGMRMVRILE